LVFPLLEPVGDGRRRRLVEDGADVQPRQPAGVGGRVALGRSEVGRAGGHDVGDRLAAGGDLGIAHDLAEDERRNVLRAEGLTLVLEDEIRVAHVLLDPRDDPVGLHLGRLLGGVAHDDVVVSPSKSTTEGEIRSLSGLGTITALPCSSTYAIAE
jgi:hypothetical protein